MSHQSFPPGWDEEKVRKVLDYYENQSEEDELAEIEAALDSSTGTFVQIPNELLPAVRALIAHYEALKAS